MKKLKIPVMIVLSLLLVVGVTACGENNNSVKESSKTESEKQEVKKDALADTIYRLVEEEYDDDTMIPDHKLADKYKFADDGTFERSYQTMSVVMVDKGLEPRWNNKEESGTYTIDGDKVTITGIYTGEKEMTFEGEDLVWNSEEMDITGNNLKVRRVYSR